MSALDPFTVEVDVLAVDGQESSVTTPEGCIFSPEDPWDPWGSKESNPLFLFVFDLLGFFLLEKEYKRDANFWTKFKFLQK